jgi:8-amino-7-oxononanoate synthase
MTGYRGRNPLGWISKALDELAASTLERNPYRIEAVEGPYIYRTGRRFLLAASNDYLGLRLDPRLTEAAVEATRRWGAGSGASPLVSGYTDLQRELESALAGWKGKDDCIVFSSGYLANLGTITSLISRGDAVFSDELNHASIIDACRLSGAEIRVFRHLDYDHLEELVRKGGFEKGLVVTDSVFSMDGDVADLRAVASIAEKYGLMTMIDEAHATGVVGEEGKGLAHAQGVTDRIDVIMGTLSKALGSQGGFVCGERMLIRWLRNKARSFIFDTAPAPAVLGAAVEAVRIARCEHYRRARIESIRDRLASLLSSRGFPVGKLSAGIVPIIVGDARDALEAAELLLECGVFAPAIRPPSVPPKTSRIRLTVSGAFGPREEEILVKAVDTLARRFGNGASRDVLRPQAR